jgi:ankyrin repeat protein
MRFGVYLFFGAVFGGIGAVGLAASSNPLSFSMPNPILWVFTAIGALLTYIGIRSLVERAKLKGARLTIEPTSAGPGESLTMKLRIEKQALAGRSLTARLVEQTLDEGWQDERHIESQATIHPGLLEARTSLIVPLDAEPASKSRRWIVRVVIDGFTYAPIERAVTLRSSASASTAFRAAPTVSSDAFVSRASPSFTATTPLEWSPPHRVMQILGGFLLLFGVLFMYLPTRSLRWPESNDFFEVGQLLFYAPFLFAGLFVAAFGIALLIARQRVRVDASGISVQTTFGPFAKKQTLISNADIAALRPVVQSTTRTGASNVKHAYGLGVVSLSEVLLLPSETAARSDDIVLRKLAEQIAAALGRDDMRFDPTPAKATKALYAITAPSSQSKSTRPFAWGIRFVQLGMLIGFIGFTTMFVSMGFKSNGSKKTSGAEAVPKTANTLKKESLQTIATEPFVGREITPELWVQASSAPVSTEPFERSNFILRNNEARRFAFSQTNDAVRLSAMAQWSLEGNTLIVKFDRVDIDHYGTACQWHKCESISHIQLSMNNLARGAVGDAESDGWISEPILLEPPIAFGEQRTLRTLSFTVPLASNDNRAQLYRDSLAFVVPGLYVGRIYGDGGHTMGPVRDLYALPFAEADRAPDQAHPCERNAATPYLIVWGCSDAAIKRVAAAKSVLDLNDLVSHPKWFGYTDAPFNSYKTSLLHLATEVGDVQIVQKLLARGVDPNKKDSSGDVPLGIAVENGDLLMARHLIAAETDVKVIRQLSGGTRVRSLLHTAVYYCDAPMAKLLVERGADVLAETDAKWSALGLAMVYPQCIATIEAIVKAGKLDVNAPIPFHNTGWSTQGVGSSPLLIAITFNNAKAIPTLLKLGGDTSRPGPWGFPVGHFAAYFGHVETLEAMRAAGIDLLRPIAPDRPHAGETYLMHAVHGGKERAIEYLLRLGADPKQKDAQGRDAADHAVNYKHFALAAKLKSGWLKPGARQ